MTFLKRPFYTMRGTIMMPILIWMILIGAAERPLVTFNPNWAKVFKGECITLVCNINSAHQTQTFSWYKDNEQIPIKEQTYTISYTETRHSGNYQCRTASSEISDVSWLEVTYGYLVLQVPPFVYEGDDVLLRCYSWPAYSVRHTMFYKNNIVIKSLDMDPQLFLYNVNKDAAGQYKCVKKSHLSSATSYTDESFLYVKDLFSSPEVTVTLYPVAEGDNMTLTCNTVLSPSRRQTELHFAFYRDGQYAQRFSLSNRYRVPFAQLDDSGNYSCVVKTSSSRVKKISKPKSIQIQDLFGSAEISFTPHPAVEGDHLTFTCTASLGALKRTTELQFAFYKEGRNVRRFGLSDWHKDCCAQLEDSGNYSCEVKALDSDVKKLSKELSVSIQELFPTPFITAIPVVEGDHMTLTCNTSLSPLRQKTELHFAFYRDGHDIQGFSLSDRYEVHSVQLENSGNYSCKVRSSVRSVKKRSEEINIQFKSPMHRRYELMNITRLALAIVTYFICCFMIFKYY